MNGRTPTLRMMHAPLFLACFTCNQAKDRLPFPIGYTAVRKYCGHDFRLHILEGDRGPKFEVTCEDGLIESGDTPDAAWSTILKRKHGHSFVKRKKDFAKKSCGLEAYGFKKHAVKELLRTLLETPSHIISSPTTPRQRLAIGAALQSSLELLKVDAVEDFQGPDDRQDGNVGLAADFDFQSSEEARAEIGHVLEARVAAAVVQDVPVREMEMVCFGAPEKAVEPVTEEVKERCIGDLRTYKKRKKVEDEAEKPERRRRQSARLKSSTGPKHKEIADKKEKSRSNDYSKMQISEDLGQGVSAPNLLQPAPFSSTPSPKQPPKHSGCIKSAPPSQIKSMRRARKGKKGSKKIAAISPLPLQAAEPLVLSPPPSPPPPPPPPPAPPSPLMPTGFFSIKAQSQPSSPPLSLRITNTSPSHTPEDCPDAVGSAKIVIQDRNQCSLPLEVSIPAERESFVIATVLKAPEEVDLMADTEPDPGPLSTAAEGEELTSRLTKTDTSVEDGSLGSSLEGAEKNCGLLTQMARVAGKRMKAQAAGALDSDPDVARDNKVVMGLKELAEAALDNDQLTISGSQDEERGMLNWSQKGRRNSRGRVKARRGEELTETKGEPTREKWKVPCTGVVETLHSSPISSERVKGDDLEYDEGIEEEDNVSEECDGTGKASGEHNKLTTAGGLREEERQGKNVVKGVIVVHRARAPASQGQDVMSQMERHNSQHQTLSITPSRQATGGSGQEPGDGGEECPVRGDADQTPCRVWGSPGGRAFEEKVDDGEGAEETELKVDEVDRMGSDARGGDGGEGEEILKSVPSDIKEVVYLDAVRDVSVQVDLTEGNDVRLQASGMVSSEIRECMGVGDCERRSGGMSKGKKTRGKKVSVVEMAKASAGGGLMDMWTKRHTSNDAPGSAAATTDAEGESGAEPPCHLLVPKTPGNEIERESARTQVHGQVTEAKHTETRSGAGTGGWIKPKERASNQVPVQMQGRSGLNTAARYFPRQKTPSPQKLTILPSPPRPAPLYKPLQLMKPPPPRALEDSIQATSLSGFAGTALGSRVTGGGVWQRQPFTDMGMVFNGERNRSLDTTNAVRSGGKENQPNGRFRGGKVPRGNEEWRTQDKGENGKIPPKVSCSKSVAIASHPRLLPLEERQAEPEPQPVVKPKGWDFNRLGELNPVCCLNHPLPVQALKVHGAEGGTSGLVLVCCGEEGSDQIQLLVYEVTLSGDRCHLVSSLALRAAREEGEAIDFEGIAIAPGGAHVAFVNSFSMAENSARSKKGIRLIPFRSSRKGGVGDADLDVLELETDVAMRCLLVPDGTTLVAAGEGGKIQCWQWDNSDVYKSPSARWHLPPAHFKGIPFVCLRQLAVVPGQNHRVVGRDSGGSLAAWDTRTRTLLTATHPLNHLIVSVSVLGPTKATPGTGQHPGPHADLAVVGGAPELAPAVSTPLVPLNLIVTVKRKGEVLGEEAGEAGIQSELYSCHLAWLHAGAIVITHDIDPSATSACGVGTLGMLGCNDGSVCLWNVTTGVKVARMQEMSGSPVRHLSAHPMLPIAAAASSDGGQVMVYTQNKDERKGAKVA